MRKFINSTAAILSFLIVISNNSLAGNIGKEKMVMEVLKMRYQIINSRDKIPLKPLLDSGVLPFGYALSLANPEDFFSQSDVQYNSQSLNQKLIIAGINKKFFFLAIKRSGYSSYSNLMVFESGSKWKLIYNGIGPFNEIKPSLEEIRKTLMSGIIEEANVTVIGEPKIEKRKALKGP